jgi:hypothetical protein
MSKWCKNPRPIGSWKFENELNDKESTQFDQKAG